jgi:hypothetical protein
MPLPARRDTAPAALLWCSIAVKSTIGFNRLHHFFSPYLPYMAK